MSSLDGDLELHELVGRTIVSVRRIRYVEPDGSERPHGPIEFSLDGGDVIVFDAGPDGESLRVDRGPWRDPFEGAQSAENRSYLARVGKWVPRDVSVDDPYHQIIGSQITDIEAIKTPVGKIAGTWISTATSRIRVEVQADDLTVAWDESKSTRST